LRRTFGAFDAGERRAIGDRVAGGRSESADAAAAIDAERAAGPLETLGALLGRRLTSTTTW
jgi:hypothetical protein